MWCIGRITEQYRERMYDVLGLYAKPYDATEPVVCLDEKSKQLLEQTRRPLWACPGQIAKEDYEYRRAGTRNLFVAVEPQAGHREVAVTLRRTKRDFVEFVRHLVLVVYATARLIHLVLDNLNTHFRASFEEVMGMEEASAFLARVQFHYTPKHASWLNMAEIEIGILDRQCIGRRIGEEARLRSEVLAWEQQRNQARRRIEWKFTRQDADQKLSRHYVT
jgi:DDE superfamily endonuclease